LHVSRENSPNMYDYRIGLILLLTLYLLSPIMIDWWLADNATWYKPFAIWFVFIALYIWLDRRRGADEH